MTEVEATTTAVTNVENAFELLEQPGFIVKIARLPVERVPRWRLEAALAPAFRVAHRQCPVLRPGLPARPAVTFLVFERVQRFLEAVGMRTLCLGQCLEPVGNFVEVLIPRRLGHTRVHVSVFVGFARNSRRQVVSR